MTPSQYPGVSGINATIRNRGWMKGMLLKNKYELVEKLGRGAYGEVWKAKDREASDKERAVFAALKLLPPELSGSPAEITRIRKNFQQVHILHHQNIVSHLALFQDGEDCAFVMELVDGMTLGEYRLTCEKNRGAFLPAEALRICRQIAEGLDYAHDRRVVHRDIKPDNIMIAGRGEVKILDFGLAAEIRSSMSRVSKEMFDTGGTRPYMAPEQWRGESPCPASDQYALAVVLYELIAGHPPFQSDDPGVLRECVLRDAPKPLAALSPKQNAALSKALAKHPEERHADCRAFMEALEEEDRKPGKENAPRPLPAQSRLWMKTAVVAALILALWIAFQLLRPAAEPVQPRNEAPRPQASVPMQPQLPAQPPQQSVQTSRTAEPPAVTRVEVRPSPAPLPTVSSGETATYHDNDIVVIQPDAHLGPGFGGSAKTQEPLITPSYPPIR